MLIIKKELLMTNCNQPKYLLLISILLITPAYPHVKYLDIDNAITVLSTKPLLPGINATTTTHVKPKTTPPAARNQTELDVIIDHNAHKYDIPAALLKAVIKQESNFNTLAVSPKGARGLMQVMPSTAADYGSYNLHLPNQNIEVGSRHLSRLLKKHDLPVALAAYNAGESNIKKYGGIPPFSETQNYILSVLKYYNLELDKQIMVANIPSDERILPSSIEKLATSDIPMKNRKKSSVLYLSLKP